MLFYEDYLPCLREKTYFSVLSGERKREIRLIRNYADSVPLV